MIQHVTACASRIQARASARLYRPDRLSYASRQGAVRHAAWLLAGSICAAAGLTAQAAPPTQVRLELVGDNFTAPTDFQCPDDGSGRKFVICQTGKIFILDRDNKPVPEPFIDVSSRMVRVSPGYDERGLLGLAFHPDYAKNGRFFLYYSAPKGADISRKWDSETHVSEFHVSKDNPNVADLASEKVILRFGQPQMNHDGGQVAFGPDRMLYISSGDGGAADDSGEGHTPETGNAQNKANLLGKILRIDVDHGDPYQVPSDNPFVKDTKARGEIYALGLRNVWRFSFDTAPDGKSRLFAGDVGQNLVEEVDIVEKGGNYGWRIREGNQCFKPGQHEPPANCPDVSADGEPLRSPILTYAHKDTGISVCGGFVYRGKKLAVLQGCYVFGDWSTGMGIPNGKLFVAQESGGKWTYQTLQFEGRPDGRLGRYLTALGRDTEGELYLLTNSLPSPTGYGGEVYKLVGAK